MINNYAERIFQNDSLLTTDQLLHVNERRLHTKLSFVATVLEEQILTFEDVSDYLQRRMKIETIDLMGLTLCIDTAKMLGHFYTLKYLCVPVKLQKNRLWVAMRDPLCENVINDLADITGYFIEPLLAKANDILYHINAFFGQEERFNIASEFIAALPKPEIKTPAFSQNNNIKSNQTQDLQSQNKLHNAPAVRFIDSIIETGVLNHASDIHFEPYNQSLRARYRVDGQLVTCEMVHASLLPNVISRLKVLGGLDIAEKRLPQDGHFNLTVHNMEVDFRISTLPTLHGEKAVLRLLYDHAVRLNKDALGFFPEDIPRLVRMFAQPYGAIFMTGPTGSGKSTTLNCFLEELNKEHVNIVTVEDPVENPIPGINHMNIEPVAGLGFANALRHILRQDPDIIMVGEIRDAETASIAIQAALTGHLVVSTLHTNDAAGVIERLVDMGMEPYLVAAALNGVIAQRLVRRICGHCKTPHELTREESTLLSLPLDTVSFAGDGCTHCHHTGYKGRFAVYEYIVMDEELRRQMSREPSHFTATLRARKHLSLKSNGIQNIIEGNTTASEIIRVLHREMYDDRSAG